MENLYTYIRYKTDLSDRGWSSLKSVLEIRNYKNGEFLLEKGEISNCLFYINKGYCRAYYDYGGQTINTNFYFESDFATNIRSLKQGVGSEYAIQAEEDMVVIVLDKDKLYALFSQSVEVDTLGRKLMEGVLKKQEKQAKLFKLDTASERYEYMNQIQPQIIKRIPLQHIASYLGISIETLTKIHSSDDQI